MNRNARRGVVAITFLVVLGLIWAVPVAGQPKFGVTIDEIEWDETSGNVEAVVTIADANGYAITGVTSDALEIEQDGVPVTLESVNEVVNPEVEVYVALVLDVSGSMEEALDDLKASAKAFLDKLEERDRVAIIAFSNEVDLGEPFPKIDSSKEAEFTHDKGRLKNLVDRLTVEEQATTPLYDALLKAVRMTERQPQENRAIIVMSDGRDEGDDPGLPGSKVATPDDPIDLAKAAGIPIYTVGLGDKIDEGYLQRVALLTGGSYNGTQDAAELGSLFVKVVNLLKTQYEISYVPAKLDGKEHQVVVKVSLPDKGLAESESVRVLYPPPLTPEIHLYYWEGEEKLPLVDGQKVRGRSIRFTPEILAQGLILRVEYYVDGSTEAAAVVEEPPFEFVWDTPKTSDAAGLHTIMVKAYDDADPAHEGSREYQVDLVIPKSWLTKAVETATRPVPGTGIPIWAAALVVLLVAAALVLLLLPKKRRCPTCGRMIPKSWEYCLFCEKEAGTATFEGAGEEGGGRITSRELLAGGETQEAGVARETGPAAPFVPRRDRTLMMHRRPEKLAYLVMQEGTHKGKQFQLGGTENSIGRADENTIVLDDPKVGRYQSKIKMEGDDLYIYDLAATNPTLVNGQKIQKHKLADGDRVQVGDTILVYMAVKSG